MKPLLINILLAGVPSLLLVIYFYRKDLQKKEPIRLIWTAFAFGFLAIIPAILVEYIISFAGAGFYGIWLNLFRAFVVAAFVEELLKLLVVRIFIYNKKAFDEIVDGIIYTVTAGLGFAFFENIFYTGDHFSVLLLRGILAVPLHATASGIMGYYLGKRKAGGPKSLVWKGLFFAVIVHGLYDFFLFTGGNITLFAIFALLAGWIVLMRLITKALKEDRERGIEPLQGATNHDK